MNKNTEREWLTVKQFRERYPGLMGSNLVYEEVRTGRLPSIRLGGKILIPSDALDRALETKQGDELSAEA